MVLCQIDGDARTLLVQSAQHRPAIAAVPHDRTTPAQEQCHSGGTALVARLLTTGLEPKTSEQRAERRVSQRRGQLQSWVRAQMSRPARRPVSG